MHSHLQTAHTPALGSETHLLWCPSNEAYIQPSFKNNIKWISHTISRVIDYLWKTNHMLPYVTTDHLVVVNISVLAWYRHGVSGGQKIKSGSLVVSGCWETQVNKCQSNCFSIDLIQIPSVNGMWWYDTLNTGYMVDNNPRLLQAEKPFSRKRRPCQLMSGTRTTLCC